MFKYSPIENNSWIEKNYPIQKFTHTTVFVSLVMVFHESLVCPEQLNFLLFFRKILQVPYILWLQHLCVFEPFPTLTAWFWDQTFHTENNWETHLQLLQKIQTLTDSPEGKTRFTSQGVKTFEQNVKGSVCVYICLVLSK